MAALADERARKQEKPVLNAIEAGTLALRLFGISTTAGILQLNSYDDANFRLREGSGESFVLKVHNGRDSSNPAFIEAQNGAMDVVRKRACWCRLFCAR